MLNLIIFISCTSAPKDTKTPVKTEASKNARKTKYYAVSVQKSTVIPNADAYYAADLDGDGTDEKIYYDSTGLRTPRGLEQINGGFQIATRADTNQDGKEELVVAVGAGKGFRSAPMTILSVQQAQTQTLWTQSMGSNQIADIHIFNKKIFFVHSFENGMFAGSFIEDETIRTVAKNRLALRMLPKSETEIYVGRVYGDEPRSDGDLFLYKDGVATQRINNFRGIRALALSDIDEDGAHELLVSDGWHYQYGTMAQARVGLYVNDNDQPIPLADLPKEYTINRIEPHRAYANVFLLQASRGAYLLSQSTFGWNSTPICSFSEGNNAVFRYEQNTTHVLCSGQRAKEYTLSITATP